MFFRTACDSKPCLAFTCVFFWPLDRHAWDMVKRANGGWYQLSVADCKALMGLPNDFKMPVPVTAQFRLLGNAITIEPARSILCECKRVLHEAYQRAKRAET